MEYLSLAISPFRSEMNTNYSELYQQLNTNEKTYLSLFPEQAPVIRPTIAKAVAETKRRFSGSGHNTPADAFRHCFWSALLCKELGYRIALRYTTVHEAYDRNPPAEKEMDLHNNAVGLKIGLSHAPDPILSDRSIAALRSGRLKVLKR
ncbi:hypothetical protein [Massilia sp. HP4]|uniref:DUF6973 domain-containing protein n=1 Tax=Massilia sp. HP4 TaxID=2562316 RepID=UPI0010C008D1|nr:hypothetical protein [Massilia sp. HP4]